MYSVHTGVYALRMHATDILRAVYVLRKHASIDKKLNSQDFF